MKVPTETEIMNAIVYAMRCEPVTEVISSEDGEYEVEILEASSLKPFTMRLLEELCVMKRTIHDQP